MTALLMTVSKVKNGFQPVIIAAEEPEVAAPVFDTEDEAWAWLSEIDIENGEL